MKTFMCCRRSLQHIAGAPDAGIYLHTSVKIELELNEIHGVHKKPNKLSQCIPAVNGLSRNYEKKTTLPDGVGFPLLEDDALLTACLGLLAICAAAFGTG